MTDAIQHAATLCEAFVCDSLYEEFKRPEYAPPPLLKRMVASGRLGKKSGRGFYEYARAREELAA